MICQYCGNHVERRCTVSMFVDGRNEDSIQNTVELARLCNACVVRLTRRDITLPVPDNALTFAEMFSWGK